MTKIQSAFNIYIGFGGAGGKVLAELAVCIGQDFKASQKADMDYGFVLVDTDQRELGESAAKIDRKLSSLVSQANLMIHLIPIGGPLAYNFGGEVTATYEDCRKKLSPQDFELLKQAWWTVEGKEGTPEKPLALAAVENSNEGASQMPLASHLMTFWNEADIKRTVSNLVDSYRIRFGNHSSEKQVNMYFVTSLAGGTGRGSWASFAYMFRQAFEEQGITAKPLGLFLDAGPFLGLFANQPDKQVQTQLNALTGFSELAMFLRNSFSTQIAKLGRSEKLEYRLPSLSGGEMVRAKVSDSDNRGGPVDGALVIFRGNQAVPFLSKDKMYYEVAAQTLFMFLCDNDFRSKTWNNKGAGQNLYAVGASSAYVPSAELKDYVEDYKKSYFLKREASSGTKTADERAAITEILRNGSSPESLKGSIFDANWKVTFASELLALLAKMNNGKLKIDHGLLDAAKNNINNYKSPSFSGKLQTWVNGRGAVTKHQKKDNAGKLKVDEELSEPDYYAKAPDANMIAEAIVRSVMKFFLLSGKSGLSLQECVAVLEDIRSDWKNWAAKVDVKLSDLHAEITKKAGRDGFLGLIGERFTSDELRTIGESAGTYSEGKCKNAAAEEILKYRDVVVIRLKEAIDSLKRFEDGILSLAKQVETGSDPKEPKKEKKKHTCFADFDSEKKAQLLLPDARFGQDVRINFKLRPIKTEDFGARLNAAIEVQWGNPDDLESLLFKPALDKAKMAVFSAVAAEAGTPGTFSGLEAARASALRTFESALGVIRCVPKFVEENFSLEKVLGQYAELIPQVYLKLKTEDQIDFAEQALKIFGIDDPYAKSSVSEMGAGLAAFLTVNCHPFATFNVSRGKKIVTDVSVLIPDLDGKSLEDLEKLFFDSATAKEHGLEKIKKEGKRGVTVKNWGGAAFAINVFCASASQDLLNLDSEDLGFSSLDYWKESAHKEKLQQLLYAAEDAGSRNLAYGHELSKNGGIGFIDPRFVKEEQWARLRWRPWPRPDSATQKDIEAQADAQVLAYLCLGNLRPEELRKKGEISALATLEKLRALELKEDSWQLPVLGKEAAGTGWVWTRRVYQSPGRVVSPQLCKSWKQGGKLRNLGNLIDAVKQISIEDKEKVRKEIEMLREVFKGTELDLSEGALTSVQNSVKEFLMWLQENESENFADKPEKMASIKALLDAAANAAESLFVSAKS
jgi:Tubulin like